jgi:hypothetical protein
MRLIDADALKNALIECTPYAIDPVYRNTNSNIDMFTAMEILDELPTVDAMPVVRGEWVKKHDDVCFWYECSVCGHTPPRDEWGHTWFSVCCPNCGAKMEDKS